MAMKGLVVKIMLWWSNSCGIPNKWVNLGSSCLLNLGLLPLSKNLIADIMKGVFLCSSRSYGKIRISGRCINVLALKRISKSDPDKRPSADFKGKFVPRVGESLSKSGQRIFWRKKLYLKRNIGTFSLVQSKVPICLGHVFADSLGLISYLTAKWKSILFPAIHVLGYTKGYSFRFYRWCLQIWLPLHREWGKMLVNLVSALLQIGTGLRQLAN